MPVVVAAPLKLKKRERVALEEMVRSSSLPYRQVVQARGLLLAADGVSNLEIARQCATTPNAVRRWRARFAEAGVDGVGVIAEGRGRSSWLPAGTVEAVVNDTLHATPDDGSTHWTTRLMAARHGIGKDSVARIWRDHQLKPWKVDTFKISTDPDFEAKLVDVVGLYMNPPERAVVFSFDEKTQCQALDRTQPSLPMTPGRAGTMTHDYKRNGTTDLFAAMNVATGEVIYDTKPRHRAKEVLAFFKLIDLHVPRHLEVHVVLDNLSAHKAEAGPLAPALHADLVVVAEPGRGLVQPAHRTAATPRHVLQRRRARGRHRDVDRALERRPPALHLDQDRHRDHRQGQTWPSHPDLRHQIRDGPLA
jgi:transposase